MQYEHYVIWSGSMHLGDTPGVFMNGQYGGLLLRLPFTVTYLDDQATDTSLVLVTTDVEIHSDNSGQPLTHPVFLNWDPGTSLPAPAGFIDDKDPIPGHPEFHPVQIPTKDIQVGQHSLTIQVNPKVAKGMRDDFVLLRLEAHNGMGARIGW